MLAIRCGIVIGALIFSLVLGACTGGDDTKTSSSSSGQTKPGTSSSISSSSISSSALSSSKSSSALSSATTSLSSSTGVFKSPGRETVENATTHCTPPTQFPAVAELPDITELPNPFLSPSGQAITRLADWPCHKAAWAAVMQHYQFGFKPSTKSVNTTFIWRNGKTLVIKMNFPGTALELTVSITKPVVGQPPYPAMIVFPGSNYHGQLQRAGVATVEIEPERIAEEGGLVTRGKGGFYTVFGSNYPAGTSTALAWGVSRILDALENQEVMNATLIDPTRVGVTGCGFLGKGALLAGVLDERIALTMPQESSGGGSSTWRGMDWMLSRGQPVQDIAYATGRNPWYLSRFTEFVGKVNKLPYDSHLLMGLVAPRALLILDNSVIPQFGNQAGYTGAITAKKIYQALGINDRMGVSQVGYSQGCAYYEKHAKLVTAFAEKFLVGKSQSESTYPEQSTDVMVSSNSYDLDLPRWQPWGVPSLNP